MPQAKKWILLCLFLIVACGEKPLPPVKDINRAPPKLSGYHTVKEGETLYAIAWRYNRDYQQLAQVNNLRSPYTLHEGDRLSLAQSAPPPKQTTQASNTSKRPVVASKPVQKTSTTTSNKNLQWYWPADGKIISTFSQQKGLKGIDISGKMGQPILSASDGEVVYSGSGLRGYGQLIIIKHNDSYLSAYAHNSKLLVREGERVKALQKIAEMGQTDTDSVRLHFEIRQQGNPVDPLRFLPKKS